MKKNLNQILLAIVFATVLVGIAQSEVNMVSWGGAYTHSQKNAYADTWDAGTVNFLNIMVDSLKSVHR